MVKTRVQSALNAICPYFTMFPLEFPIGVLCKRARPGDWVLDPFCGRGTTNYAARSIGLPTLGLDVNPVAIAVTKAKLVAGVTPAAIASEAERILRDTGPCEVPSGEFWDLAYDQDVLQAFCCLRRELISSCSTSVRKALRAVLLGGLHGPMKRDGSSSYFSNQAPRTYAPKPRYAAGYWRRHHLAPPRVDVIAIIRDRAERYYGQQIMPAVPHCICEADSRDVRTMAECCAEYRPRWIITSPPYYGLRTYVPDQWLRVWFLGGGPSVDYSYGQQLSHRSRDHFVGDLRTVWNNVASVATKRATLVVRFGAINDRATDPCDILKQSLQGTPWKLATIASAAARVGKRQVRTFLREVADPVSEIDAWARLS